MDGQPLHGEEQPVFNQRPYRTFVRDSELNAATPANLFVIADEHESHN